MPDFSACDLHIPNKQWSNDPLEEQNYLAIERWARNFRQNCVGGGGCDCFIGYGSNSQTGVAASSVAFSFHIPGNFTTLTGTYGLGNCVCVGAMTVTNMATPHSKREFAVLPSTLIGQVRQSDLGLTTEDHCYASLTTISDRDDIVSTRFATDCTLYDIFFEMIVWEMCSCNVEFPVC